MSNNPANDRYNPKGAWEEDYDATTFSELPEGSLFWLKTEKGNNPAFRKLDAKKALHTAQRHQIIMEQNKRVFVKI